MPCKQASSAFRITAFWHLVVCRFPALERLAGGIKGSLPGLASQIWRCISAGDGRVLDGASSALADTRARRQQNLGELRSTIEEWARSMHRLGAAERAQVIWFCHHGDLDL